MKRSRLSFAAITLSVLLINGCAKEEDDEITSDNGEGESEEDLAWGRRIDAAFDPYDCPDATESDPYSSSYSGRLIDTHFHIPAISDSDPTEEDDGSSSDGVTPVLGENVTINSIACTLEREGTEKVYAFFPVYLGLEERFVEVVSRTMQLYPEKFVPFIMPPGGSHGTVNGEDLAMMLSIQPGLFSCYGEIGMYSSGSGIDDDLPPDDPLFDEIYQVVETNSLVVYMHPGEGHAALFESVLEEHPDINFIVHGEQIENNVSALMDQFSNIFFTVNDLYGDQYLLHQGETQETFLAALENYEPLLEADLATWKDRIEANPDQFLWGTDRGGVAVWTLNIEVGQELTRYGRAFIGRLDPAVQERFAYENAERIFGN